MEVMKSRLRDGQFRDCTRSRGRCADFYVPEEERRVWSPCLSVQVEERDRGSLLRGRFGPHPEIWTFFMFLYGAVGFAVVMGLMLGFVQWQSGMEPWGLWGVWVGVPGLASLYGISAVGQKLSAHQMDALKERMEELAEGLVEEGTDAEHA
jgi:hypothetical protein